MFSFSKSKGFAYSVLLLLGLSSCSMRSSRVADLSGEPLLLAEYNIRRYGRVATFTKIQDIKLGLNQQEIKALLGSPSFSSLFGEAHWYYLFTYEEGYRFAPARFSSHTILKLSFDSKGILTNFEQKPLSVARRVVFDSEETETYGKEYSMLKRLFSSFDKKAR